MTDPCPPVTFAGDRMRIKFASFGIPAYELFLRAKRLPEWEIEFDPEGETYTIDAPARFAPVIGVQPPTAAADPLPLAAFLYDDQRELTAQALLAKRFAVWAGCGNGKTLIGLEFARHVVHRLKKRVLIVTRNEIVQEWLDQARQFYGDTLPVHRLTTRAEMKHWMKNGERGFVGITNYEKWNPESLAEQVVNEARHLGGVVLDEASRLRGGGGRQKWAIIKSCRGVEYKLSLTATPAPNDTIEFASQAAFLEKMRAEGEIIWTYFVRDPVSHRWTVKPHARRAFFEFMSSWSVYVNDPKHYGWRAGQPDVPRPVYRTIDVPPTAEQLEWRARVMAEGSVGSVALYADATNAIQRNKLSQVAKGFRYRKVQPGDARKGKAIDRSVRIPSNKPAVVAEIVRREAAAGAQVLVWTVFNEETDILAGQLADVRGLEVLSGSTPTADRPAVIDRFRRGETRVLIAKARMLGYGMNLQHCTAMVFSGWTDSFEDLYQSVRRAVRHGQTEAVRVYFPVVRELEGDTLDNIRRKEAEFEQSIREMEEHYLRARAGLKGVAA